MAEIEVTWDLYELFLNRTSDQAKGEKGNIQIDIDGVSGATQPYVNYNKNGYPTINITQYAASQFCKWLTAKTGNYYRLPTEAEWEYACRGGSQKAYSFGNKSKNITKYAWYNKNSDGKTHKGGQKLPNAHGLYDMHGNVAEWVLDSYSPETYIVWGKGANNPVKKNQALYPRVVRGGSYKDDLNKLRSASRGYSTHRWKQRDPQVPKSLWWHVDATHIGFRIVRPRIEPKKEDLNKMWVRPKKEY
jgi:formylglycine-generating enzyme required for sulfatase activity